MDSNQHEDMAEGCFPTQPAADINAAVQALSALLRPQGKMLQVTPITKDETPENMSSDGNDKVETQGKPTEHSADLSSVAMQQVVLQSGVIKAVLQAVRHAGNRSSTGNI